MLDGIDGDRKADRHVATRPPARGGRCRGRRCRRPGRTAWVRGGVMIVVLAGHPRPHSRTLHLAEEVAAALAGWLGQPAPDTLDVAALGERLFRPGDVDVAAALTRLRRATLLVAATPAYQASYTG